MVLQIILVDILLVACIFPRPCRARKNTTQLVKYPRVLSVKPSNKVYVFVEVTQDLFNLRPLLSTSTNTHTKSRLLQNDEAEISSEIQLGEQTMTFFGDFFQHSSVRT